MAYYIIQNEMTGFVLDCEGGAKPGTKVIPYTKHGKDNQVWFDNVAQGTICSKANPSLCLDVEKDQLVVKPFLSGDKNQQWYREGKFIRNRVDHNKVIDVTGMNREKGAPIGMYKFNGGPNQCFEFEMVGGSAPVQPPAVGAATSYPGYPNPNAGRDYYIVSQMNSKVLDIEGESTAAGAKILTWEKHSPPKKNQLFKDDNQGYIVSSVTGMTFSNAASTHVLKTQAATGDPRSQWKFEDNKVVSRAGEVLDISRSSNSNGAEVISYPYKGAPNQHWRKEYV